MLRLLCCTLVVLTLISLPAGAQRISYILDVEDRTRRVPAPLAYVYECDIRELGLEGAQDLFLSEDGYIYIADTNNHRIVKIDKQGNVLLEIPKEKYGDGRLFKPEGVFVTPDNMIYVADTGNSRIALFDPEGNFVREFGKPEYRYLDEDFQYQPTKVAVDAVYMYVINANDYRGMMRLRADGSFEQFFGHNKLPFSLRTVLIRMFATEAQKEKLSKELPPPHSNVFLDDSGYIYTTTIYQRRNQIKKLSSVGEDVYNLASNFYGEVERQLGSWSVTWPKFQDLAVDDHGVISTLDSASGRVYQYDQDNQLLMVFGGKGEGRGVFSFPSSIVVDDSGMIYVLDKDRNNIQVFRPTHFANLVHHASELYFQGFYEQAAEPWHEVLSINSNYYLAYSGIGKAYYKLMEWEKAMEYFRYGKDRENYSMAFAEYRHDYVRANFGKVVLYVFLVLLGIYLLVKLVQWVLMRPEEKSGFITQVIRQSYEVMIHPDDGFRRLKSEGTIPKALFIILLVVLCKYFSIYRTSFQIRNWDPEDIDLIVQTIQVILPWALWIIASYGVTIIYEGEGFVRDIVIASAYCLVPYILSTVPLTLLTSIAARTEANYFRSVGSMIMFWCVTLFVLHVRTTHNFQLKKAIGVSALSLFGMGAFVGAVGLTFGLINQLINFIQEIIVELSIR